MYHEHLPLLESLLGTDDRELSSLLLDPSATEVVYFLDRLWQEYSPFILETQKFLGGLRAQPFTRIWEMYLGCALRERKFDLNPKGEAGPDIKLVNPTIWVEAVASTDGAKGNKNGIQPAAHVPKILLSESMWGGPPDDAIILRCLSSIDAKLKKLNRYRDSKDKGIVGESEPYVVALNTYKTSFAQLDHQHTPNHIPTIVKAVFGYGERVLLQFHPRDGLSAPISSGRFDNYRYRRHVNRTPVRTDIFFQEEYSGVSALIVSKEGYWSWRHRIPPSLSENFILVHNPLAINPLPKLWLKSGHEIWIEQGELLKRVWRDGTEHQIERFPLPYDLPHEIRAKITEEQSQVSRANALR
jgi:hypothetical protein